jgi:hypothetical protein
VNRGWFPVWFSWPTQVWSVPYDRYIYTGPGLSGYYYFDQDANRYFPVSRLTSDDSDDGSVNNSDNGPDNDSADDNAKQENQDGNS